ncbi:MAG TPA: glycosyl hydrolase family 28-related protein, partial [Pyrinomonadaceae bacterium]
MKRILLMAIVASLVSLVPPVRITQSSSQRATDSAVYNVKTFGATGDGKTLDTPAINKTIDAAAAAGGGTVYFPAGNYLSVSIHLKSNIALYLDQGSTIIAANTTDNAKYDSPEPN